MDVVGVLGFWGLGFFGAFESFWMFLGFWGFWGFVFVKRKNNWQEKCLFGFTLSDAFLILTGVLTCLKNDNFSERKGWFVV